MSMDMNAEDLLASDTTITLDSNVASALVAAIEKLVLNNAMPSPGTISSNSEKETTLRHLWSNGEPTVHKIIWNITFYKDPAGDKITTLISDLNGKEPKVSHILTALENNSEGTLSYIIYCPYARRILNEPWALHCPSWHGPET